MTTTTAIRVQSASAGATEPDNITAINPTGPPAGGGNAITGTEPDNNRLRDNRWDIQFFWVSDYIKKSISDLT